MRAHGACTALVSGGFTAFTRHVQAPLRLRPRGGQRAGDRGRHADRPAGRRAARGRGQARARWSGCARSWASPPATTMAVGDGANDLPMLHERRAGRGVPRPPSASGPRHRCGSTMATSPRCCSCRATGATSSSPPEPRYSLKRSATKRRSPWRSISSRIDFLPSCLRLVDLRRHLGRRADLLLADLDDQVAGLEALLGRRRARR